MHILQFFYSLNFYKYLSFHHKISTTGTNRFFQILVKNMLINLPLKIEPCLAQFPSQCTLVNNLLKPISQKRVYLKRSPNNFLSDLFVFQFGHNKLLFIHPHCCLHHGLPRI